MDRDRSKGPWQKGGDGSWKCSMDTRSTDRHKHFWGGPGIHLVASLQDIGRGFCLINFKLLFLPPGPSWDSVLNQGSSGCRRDPDTEMGNGRVGEERGFSWSLGRAVALVLTLSPPYGGPSANSPTPSHLKSLP